MLQSCSVVNSTEQTHPDLMGKRQYENVHTSSNQVNFLFKTITVLMPVPYIDPLLRSLLIYQSINLMCGVGGGGGKKELTMC
jgi:hypothetical protein